MRGQPRDVKLYPIKRLLRAVYVRQIWPFSLLLMFSSCSFPCWLYAPNIVSIIYWQTFILASRNKRKYLHNAKGNSCWEVRRLGRGICSLSGEGIMSCINGSMRWAHNLLSAAILHRQTAAAAARHVRQIE